MIQMNSRVFIADNTGAKSAEMIRRLGQNKRLLQLVMDCM